MCKWVFVVYMGALTSKPYAFTARSWELKSFDSLDFFDGLLTAVRYDLRGTEVMRVLPRKSQNEEWITDKVRFAYDGFRRQRLYRPYIRVWQDVHSFLVPVSWHYILDELSNFAKLSSFSFDSLAGNFVDLETQLTLKEFTLSLGGTFSDSAVVNSNINLDFRNGFLFDFSSFETSELIILLGCNLRFEAPLLNVKLRRRVNSLCATVVRFGFISNLTYENFCFGGGVNHLLRFITGKEYVSLLISKVNSFFVLLGNSSVSRADGLLNIFNYLKGKLNFTLSVLPLSASSMGVLDLGPVQTFSNLSSYNWLYLLDVDNVQFSGGFYNFFWYNLVIYQGHHGDINASIADIILPGVLPIERQGTFIDIKGELKQSKFIVPPSGEARIDWKIIVALSDFLKISLPFREFSSLNSKLSSFGLGSLVSKGVLANNLSICSIVYNVGFQNIVGDFYLSDSVTRSSLILALTSNRFSKYNKIWW
jgi:NADH-quinone oxidoreductase subunit G